VSGELPPGVSNFTICTDDSTCYKLILRSQTLAWQGRFRLYDIFGDILFEAANATFDPVVSPLCTPVRHTIDVGAYQLLAPLSGPNLGIIEAVKMGVRNFGLQAKSGIQVAYRLDGGFWHTETLPGMLGPGAIQQFQFATVENLSQQGGQYDFELRTTVAGDEDTGNDTLQRRVLNRLASDLAVEKLHTIQLCSDGDTTLAQASVLLRNNGLATSYSFEMQYSINGVAQVPQPGYVEIPIDQTSNFYFSLQGTVSGQNNLLVHIGKVNGQSHDDAPANDTTSASFAISPHGVQYILNTFTDNHPEQTSWQLADGQGEVLRSFGPYDLPFTGFVEYLCLPLDSCYQLRLLDSGGDGMQGSGALLTTQQAVWTLTDNNFGSLIETPFCVAYDCANLQLTAVITPDALATPNPDGTILAQATGGIAPYQYALDNGVFQSEPLFAGLPSDGYVLHALDANGCARQQQVFVDLLTAAREPTGARLLLASPNPTKGLVNLRLPALGKEQMAICEVLDSRGKMLQTARLVRWDDQLRGVVALDTYPPGLYLLRLRGLGQVFSVGVIKD
ncbi:MAG: SprB repeat-containing protein, partial [Saprospiraceae bacterium]